MNDTTTIEQAISDAATAGEAVRAGNRAARAWKRGELTRAVAMAIFNRALDRSQTLPGCPHGEPTTDDCNTCCMEGRA